MLPVIFLLFLVVPLFELWFLIEVGGVIGALPTIALVVLTALIGAALARLQGVSTLQRVQASMAQGRAPALEMLEGTLIFVAAVLLLTPGFFTDALGFACLVPPLRRALARRLLRRFVVSAAGPGTQGGGRRGEHHIIEGEFRREEQDTDHRARLD